MRRVRHSRRTDVPHPNPLPITGEGISKERKNNYSIRLCNALITGRGNKREDSEERGASGGGGGVEAVAQMVAEKVKRHHRKENEDARNQDPWVARQVLHVLRLREKISPARGRLLNSQSEQRERAFAQDEAGNRERGRDYRVANHRRNDVTRDDAPSRCAQRARGLDVR